MTDESAVTVIGEKLCRRQDFSERPDLIKRTLSSEVSHRDESIELSIVSEDKS